MGLKSGNGVDVAVAPVAGADRIDADTSELTQHSGSLLRPDGLVRSTDEYSPSAGCDSPEALPEVVLVPIALVQSRGVVLIVVHGEKVGTDVLPAIVGDDEARVVDALGQVVDGTDEVALTGVRADVLHPPTLVERHPGNDAGMAGVAPYRVGPFGEKACTGRVRELVDARHLLPDEQADPVGPVEESRVLDLLVHTDGGEPELLDELYL